MTSLFTDPDRLSAADLEAGAVLAPRFDAAGLIAAIAVDHKTNDVLMLAHMNEQALRLTLETGEAHYYSRSRGKIWKKGETSGEVQKLVEMRIDCDQDAIVMRVDQTGRGAACHTGRPSCFYRRIDFADGAVRLETTGPAPLFDPNEVYGG